MPLRVTVGTVTDRGLNPKRAANEDRLLALPQARLFLVADGVGGRRGGQVASQTVVDVFKQAFSEQPRQGNDLLSVLKQTIHLSNRSIHDSSSELPDLRGMATTVALVAAMNDTRAIIGHVGDSRVYRFDGREMVCETEDHSEVNDAVRAGVLSVAQAAHHPRRNVINRAVGADADVEADFKIVPLNERTSFLLCSDGITRHVTDAELGELMRSRMHPQKLCTQLKEICYERGAEDNLTAIIVDFGERTYADSQTRPAISRVKAAQATGSRFQVDFSDSTSVLPGAPNTQHLTTEVEPTRPSPAGRGGQAGKRDAQSDAISARERTEPAALAAGKQPEAKGNSSVTFWGDSATKAYEKPVNTPANTKKSNAFGRDLAGLVFYVLLLAVAFGAGRYYEELVSWVTGAPLRVENRATLGNRTSDPEVAAARALFNERRYPEARERLAHLLAAKADNAEVRYWLGRTSYELKQYPEAAKHLSEAARLDARLPDVYLHLALAYSAQGDKKNVDEALKKAVVPAQ
jgi:serine/threonine protein phosphatase PrpC